LRAIALREAVCILGKESRIGDDQFLRTKLNVDGNKFLYFSLRSLLNHLGFSAELKIGNSMLFVLKYFLKLSI